MKLEILGTGGFQSARVELAAGESFVSESGAMYRASANVDVDVTTKSVGGGGLLAGVKRLIARESFFMSTYRTTDGAPGEVALAPVHQGEVRHVVLDGRTTWSCAGGSWLGSGAQLKLETRFQGLKGFFSGEALSFLEVSGAGDLLVNGFGRIHELDVERDAGGRLTVDTGHLVAFETTLQWSLDKASNSWLDTYLSGEGFVLQLRGAGRVLVQSHNPNEFGKALGPLLPPRG